MSAYSDAVLVLSPLAYWRLGEASGTVAHDEIGAHNGTYLNSPTLGVAGLLNGDPATAMGVPGSGSKRVSIADADASLTLTPGAFTLGFWVRNDWSAVEALSYPRILTGPLLDLWYVSQSGLIYYNSNQGTSITLGNGTRVFVVIAYDGTTLKCYKNGAQTISTARTIAPLVVSAAIYLAGSSGGAALKGALQEVSLWNRALSAAEIAGLYAAGTKAYGTGALASTATLAATGTKGAAGTGTLAETLAMSATGHKAASGIGALASVVTFDSTGIKGAAGAATMALSAVLSATGRKAASGVGALIETLVMAASGVKFLWPGLAARMRLTSVSNVPTVLSVSDAPTLRVVSDAPTIERLT